MKLTQLIQEANALADEQEQPEVVTSFINDAIAAINTRADANFPFLTLANDEEPAFSESWQRTLLIPFAVGRIKQKDASQFEFSQAYTEFFDSLQEFIAKYKIPDEYKATDSLASSTSDIYTTPPFSFWRW